MKNFEQSFLIDLPSPLELIKYPPPDTPVPEPKSSASQTNQVPQSNGRPTSPPAAPIPQIEDPRRAISPTVNIRSNGMVQQTFGSNNKGKAPVRPRREDESTEGSAEAGTTDPISYSQYRDRAMSPDQVRQQAQRVKSPPSGTVGRTVSPNSDLDEPRQPPNMVSVSMGMNGAAAERGSPAISAVTGRTSPYNGNQCWTCFTCCQLFRVTKWIITRVQWQLSST